MADTREKTNTESHAEFTEMEEISSDKSNSTSTERIVTKERKIKSSFGMSVLNLCNTLLGGSILAMPFAMANTGILLFGFLMTLIATCSVYSGHLMLKSAEVAGVQTYTQLGYRAFGRAGKLLVVGAVSLDGTGALSTYLYVVKNQLPSVISGLLGSEDDSQAWFLNGNYLVMIVSGVVIFPLCLMRRIGYLTYTSGLSLLCMVFIILSVIYKKFVTVCEFTSNNSTFNTTMSTLSNYTFTTMSDFNTSTCDNTHEAKLVTFTSRSAYTIPILAFAFVFHSVVLPIYSELENASRRRMQNVNMISIAIMGSSYFLTAIFGYLTFYGNVTEDLLLSYQKNDTLMLCVRLAGLMAVIGSFPLDHFSIRQALLQLFYKDKPFHWGRHVGVAISLISFCNILVIFVPNIKEIFAVSGATTAPCLIFILPGIFYCRVIPREQEPINSRRKIMAAMFAGLGFILMLMSLIFIVMDWTIEN